MNSAFFRSNTFRWTTKVDPVDKLPMVPEDDVAELISTVKMNSLSDIKTDSSKLKPNDDDDPADDVPRTLQDLIVDSKIDRAEVVSFLQEIYASHMAEIQVETRTALDLVVEASSILIVEFANVHSPDAAVLEVIRAEIDEYVFPRISLLYTDISSIQISDVARLVRFAELYNTACSNKGMVVSMDRLADFEELATEYLQRGVHDQMKLMIGNSLRLRNDEDVQSNPEGRLISGHPEDIAFMIEMQITVAREFLPERFLSEVLTACNHELFNMISDIMLDVGSRWDNIEVEKLCAIINDSSRLMDLCEQRNEALLDVTNSEHQKAGDDLLRELAELSLHTTRFLCERIMLDLREPNPILGRVGHPIWESGALLVSETVVATLKDYANDILEWIPDEYYFPKVLKHCFDMTIQAYADSFFAVTMNQGIKDPETVARTLAWDWQNLHHFFCKAEMAEYLGRAGHYAKQEAESRIGVIQSMSSMLTPTIPPTRLQSEIKSILRQFGSEAGLAAVMHLAGLRSRRITEDESAEWRSAVAEAVQAFLTEASSKEKPRYTLPDLRNSEYIVRIRAVNVVDDDEEGANETLRQLTSQRPGLRKRWGASLRATASRRLLRSDRTLLSTWKTPSSREVSEEVTQTREVSEEGTQAEEASEEEAQAREAPEEEAQNKPTSRPKLSKQQAQSEYDLGRSTKLAQRL